MTFHFDQDIRITQQGENAYSALLASRWSIGEVPNGGYPLSIAARAIAQTLDKPHPFSLTGHYLRPLKAGPVSISVEALKIGRRVSYARALVTQDGRDCLAVTGAFGDLAQRRGMDFLDIEWPHPPALEQCQLHRQVKPFADNMHLLLTPESSGWLQQRYSEDCRLAGWLRFADGRPADVAALPLFADSFPPPIFRKTGPTGWVPTLELTLHLHRVPSPGPLFGSFATHIVSQGVLEEHGNLWDADGQLVARARQLAMLLES